MANSISSYGMFENFFDLHLFIYIIQTNVTSFVLGAEEGPLLATTAKDFDNKLQGVPVKAVPSQSTSIAVSQLPLIVYFLKCIDLFNF